MTGIARVVVDVGDRREIHLHPERARFNRRDPRFLAHQPQAVRSGNRPHRHLPRKAGRAEDAEADAGLEVGGVQQRHRRQRLQPVDEERRRKRLAENHRAVAGAQQHRRRQLRRAEHVEAADVVLAHQPRQHLEGVAVGAQEIRLERRHDQLADLLVRRERLERLLDPPLGGAVERERIARHGGRCGRQKHTGGRDHSKR